PHRKRKGFIESPQHLPHASHDDRRKETLNDGFRQRRDTGNRFTTRWSQRGQRAGFWRGQFECVHLSRWSYRIVKTKSWGAKRVGRRSGIVARKTNRRQPEADAR